MRNFLKNLFYKQPEEAPPTKDVLSENTANENSISFVLDKENNIIVRLSLMNMEPGHNYEKEFASLLYIINEGAFAGQIVEILQEVGEQEPSKAPFCSTILTSWADILDKEGVESYDNSMDDDRPIISPLHFSKKLDTGPTQ